MRRTAFALAVLAIAITVGCSQAYEPTANSAATAELVPNQKSPAEGVVSGGQPTSEQLTAARDAGYRTVINLRTAGEGGSIDDEQALVESLGMAYVSIPVAGSAGLTRDNVDAFAKALDSAEQPILVHCGSGNRIGAMYALKAFYLDGKNTAEAIQIGLDSGLTRLEGAVREILEAEEGYTPELETEDGVEADAA